MFGTLYQWKWFVCCLNHSYSVVPCSNVYFRLDYSMMKNPQWLTPGLYNLKLIGSTDCLFFEVQQIWNNNSKHRKVRYTHMPYYVPVKAPYHRKWCDENNGIEIFVIIRCKQYQWASFGSLMGLQPSVMWTIQPCRERSCIAIIGVVSSENLT